jgi:hypothetical protein
LHPHLWAATPGESVEAETEEKDSPPKEEVMNVKDVVVRRRRNRRPTQPWLTTKPVLLSLQSKASLPMVFQSLNPSCSQRQRDQGQEAKVRGAVGITIIVSVKKIVVPWRDIRHLWAGGVSRGVHYH